MNGPTSNPQVGMRLRSLQALLFAALLAPIEGSAAETATAQKRKAARDKIAAMTEAERARLSSDFKKFSAMSREEQDKLRRLDGELQNDPDLQQTMKEYREFLEPLSPGEREDLQKESDPHLRANLVRTMIKAQQDRAEYWTRRGAGRRGLSTADLDKVLGVVEVHLRTQKTNDQMEELKSKQGLARHVAILDLAFARPSAGERAWPPFFNTSQTVLDEMVAAISDPDQRQRAKRGNSPERIRNLIGMIDAGIRAEFLAKRPTDKMLGDFLAKLNGTERNEILRLPLDQQQWALLRKYAEAHPDEFPKPPRRWMSFGGERGGRRGFGPGRFPDGENYRGPRRLESGSDGDRGPPPDRRRDRPLTPPNPAKSGN